MAKAYEGDHQYGEASQFSKSYRELRASVRTNDLHGVVSAFVSNRERIVSLNTAIRSGMRRVTLNGKFSIWTRPGLVCTTSTVFPRQKACIMWWEAQNIWEVAGEAAAAGATVVGAAVYAAMRSQRRGDERRAEEARAGKTEAASAFDPKRTLERLAAYRKRDPEYCSAIASFAQAEVTEVDPVEGYAFEQQDGSEAEVNRNVHEILGA